MGALCSSQSAVDVPERSQGSPCAAPACRPSLTSSDASSGLDAIPDSVSILSGPRGDDGIPRKVEVEGNDDDQEREYSGRFEGPEKTLDVGSVRFKPDTGKPKGCRALTRLSLDSICFPAKCKILDQISNECLDAYMLSESSLFVYSHKVVLKTYGTTPLLRCVGTLLQATLEQQGLVLEWTNYSRKNFTFPGGQFFPHTSFHQELQYLRAHSHLSQQLNGAGYVLGPVTGDHWFVYVADKYHRPHYTMTDRTEVCPTARDMTNKTGITELVPGAVVDEFAFDPCGYSMNAILYESYYTIHVTPGESFSHASFETNHPFESYRSITNNNVLDIWCPKRWVLTMVADKGELSTFTDIPFSVEQMYEPLHKTNYVRTSVSSTVVEGGCAFMMSTWDMRDKVASTEQDRRRPCIECMD